mgnify:CR=1 FL=1
MKGNESRTGERDGSMSGNGGNAALRAGRSILEFVLIIVVAFVLVFLIRTFVCQTFEIPSSSMEDTIEISDRVLSEKITYYVSDVQRGDIVTFTDPTDSSRTLIKRVIATGGQSVELIDGSVYVDGSKLDEPYTEGKQSLPLSPTYQGKDISYPYTVPDGYIWVMGDNRTNSADSRYFGAVPASSVSGKAFFRYWPFETFGFLN